MPQIRVIAATSAPPITITMVSLLPTIPSSSSVVASPVVAVSFSARFFLSPPAREWRYCWPGFLNFNEFTFFSSHPGLPCGGLFFPPDASSASPRPSSPEEAGWPGPLLETSIIRMPPAFPKKQSSETNNLRPATLRLNLKSTWRNQSKPLPSLSGSERDMTSSSDILNWLKESRRMPQKGTWYVCWSGNYSINLPQTA